MKSMPLMLALGAAVAFTPFHAEAKSRVQNDADVRLEILFRATGCLKVKYPPPACSSHSDYDTSICAKREAFPGESASYGYDSGTSDRDVIVLWCDTDKNYQYLISETANHGDKSRCTVSGTNGSGITLRLQCGSAVGVSAPIGPKDPPSGTSDE